MFTVENELYVRFILLLIRGGSAVLRKIVANGLQKDGISLVEFLHSNKTTIIQAKQLNHKQIDLLYPNSPGPPDISKWDISLLCYLYFEFFTNNVNSSEHTAVSKIRDMRNQFQANYPDASIDVHIYPIVRSTLTSIITTLSNGFAETDKKELNSLVESASNANLTVNTVMDEIRMYNAADDFMELIQKQIEQHVKRMDSYHRDNETSAQNVTLKCSGVEGLQQVSNVFEGDGDAASNTIQEVSNALSKEVGQHVVIETAIDIGSIQGAITSAKTELEKDKKASKKTDENESRIDPYRVTLPVKIKMSSKGKLNEHMKEKVSTCIFKSIKIWLDESSTSAEMQCVCKHEISFDPKEKLTKLSFICKSDEDLDKIRNMTMRQKSKNELNILSEILTHYVEKQKTILNCGVPGIYKTVLKVKMPDTVYFKGKQFFSQCKEEDEETTDSDSTSESKYDSVGGATKQCIPLNEQMDSLADDNTEDLNPISVQQKTQKEAKLHALGRINAEQVQDSRTITTQTEKQLITSDTGGSAVSTSCHDKDIIECSTNSEPTDNVEGNECNCETKIANDFQNEADLSSDSIKSLNAEIIKDDKRSSKEANDTSTPLPKTARLNLEQGQEKNEANHTFLVFSPKEYLPVHLIIEQGDAKTTYRMEQHHVSLNVANVNLPANICRETKYCYQYRLPRRFRRPTQMSSCSFVLGEGTCHRDSIYGSTEDNMISHFGDILLHCIKSNAKYEDEQVYKQIENVYTSFSDENNKPDVKKIIENLKSHSKLSAKCSFLLAVIIAVFCKPEQVPTVEKMVDKDLAKRMLLALSGRSANKLPERMQHNMRYVCLRLSDINFGKLWCPIYHLDICFPFFDVQFVSAFVHEQLTGFNKLAPQDRCTEEQCKSVCKKLFERSCDKNPENILFRRVLTSIVENIPKEIAINVLHSLNLKNENMSEDEKPLNSFITDLVAKIVGKAINEFTSKRDLRSLIKFAKIACQRKTAKEISFCETFETAITDVLEFANPKVDDSIKNDFEMLLNETNCFKDRRRQTILLEKSVNSRNDDIFKLFVKLYDVKLFRETYEHLSVCTYEKWLDSVRPFRSNTQTESLLSILDEYCNIQRIAEDTRREDVISVVIDKIAILLKQMNAEDLLVTVASVEQLCDMNDLVGNLFKSQILDNLKTIRRIPYDILQLLCGRTRRLFVRCRFTADLVGTLIDRLLGQTETQTEFDYFIFLIDHVKMLKLIDKTEGEFRQLLIENKTHKAIRNCIRNVSKQFKAHEVSLPFVLHLDATGNKERARKLMHLHDYAATEIDLSFKAYFQAVTESACCMHDVLCALEKRKPKWFEISSLKAKSYEIQDRVTRGNILAIECHSDNHETLFGVLKPFQQLCKDLRKLVKSDVFWNLTIPIVDQLLSEEARVGSQSEPDTSIKYLFDNDMTVEHSFGSVLNYLKLLLKTGKQLYQKSWIDLEEDQTLMMDKVLFMFNESDLFQEITNASDILGRPIKQSTQNTLKIVLSPSTKHDVQYRVKTLRLVLDVFCPDIEFDSSFEHAVESFEDLCKHDISTYKFRDIQCTLETVFDQANILSEDSLLIMSELGSSSYLIEYLRVIASEDIRILINAVEHISEKHIQESTVSSLIEVRRLVFPFLDMKTVSANGRKWLFETINNKVRALQYQPRIMISNIDDCINNIHSLKTLTYNAGNRGELTKEVVFNIVKKGQIMFQLQNKGNNVIFHSKYKQNKNIKIKDEKTLVDLKSRVLLLMNTERPLQKDIYKRAEFKVFVDSIDLCSNIKDTLSQLCSSGHIRYTHVKLSNTIPELRATKEKLLEELTEWKNYLGIERKHFYLLNFINGRQIPILYHYLEKGVEEDIVQIIIKSIHPGMRTEDFRNSNSKGSQRNKDMLKKMGNSLESAYSGLHAFKREIKHDDEYVRQITDVVHSGQVKIVNLESSSSLVIKTILALYKNTTQTFPESQHILFCYRDTRWADIELLLERCEKAKLFYGYSPLFCLVNVEKLRREIQDKLAQSIDACTGKEYLLAVICQGSEHLFRSKANEQLETVRPLSDEDLRRILQNQFTYVLTYTSDIAGLGKTTSIYSSAMTSGYTPKTLHVSGTFQRGKVIEQLRNLKLQKFHSLHIDIASVQNYNELDIFLFELIILKYVSEDWPCCLEAKKVHIEIANTINDTLLNKLNFTAAFKRVHVSLNNFHRFLPSREISSATQVVCHYLDSLESGTLDKTEIHFTGKHRVKPLDASKCRFLMEKYIHLTGETSFNNIHIFLNVLSEQLKKLSASAFFRNSHIVDMLDRRFAPDLRSTLVKSMIHVALEFASRSVKAVKSVQSKTYRAKLNSEPGKQERYVDKDVQPVEYIIRWEDTNHLMFVFHNQNIQTLTPVYRDISKVEDRVQTLFQRQMNRPLIDFSEMKQNELQGMLDKIARKDITPMTGEYLDNMAKDYALTPDNFLKMVLVIMRIQANVPVILMGDTGCGKTSLIRYLSQICDVSFSILNIHAGVTQEEIIKQIERENDKCCCCLSEQTWLFLDEINTSQHIGVISDAICHHRCNGKVLAPNLIIMGACNPYKLRTENTTRTAGLEGKVRLDELSRFVYRVLPLPETMIDYVWDFGSLSEKDEEKYIRKMIADVFKDKTPEHALLTKLLTASQSFVRDTENAIFSVSLRDVYRCKKLVEWFDKTLLQKMKNGEGRSIETKLRSIILALAHCYHSRFAKKNDRQRYRQVLESVFASLGYQNYKEDFIHSVIKDEQTDILKRMDLPPGIAKNTALQENVFMLLVCILNKMPIFLVGKPGCSKSLAMQVIRSNIRGKDSKDEFFKTLPQLFCVSFQGSESSTSEGISTVFENAEVYQKSYAKDEVLSVVILDEIGLAEISDFDPLKVLHSLLEPNGQSTPNVAVVGISNWALDASKMNRGIHLSRPDMDTEELFETGISISESFTQNIQPNRGLTGEPERRLSTNDIQEDLKHVANAYSSYTRTLKFKNFHGLRDFYFLVKFITKTLAEEKSSLSYVARAKVIMKGLQRNFGGLPKEKHILLHHFRNCFRGNKTGELSAYDVALKDQSSTYDLVVSNIKDCNARHLMLITKGESVLAIVEDILRDANREKREIVFGSHFEDDLTDDYNYRTLSKIIMCMEQGIVLILKDLENIYGSLYDMLNQNYTRIGQKNNCRVALGPYSNPFCHVADSFRCIVLVDERKLDYTDPPFLNRFEKQFLAHGNIISQDKVVCLKKVHKWLEDFSTIDGKSFSTKDMFPIYNEEMIVSLVILNSKNIRCKTEHTIVTACKKELLWLIRPEAVIRLQNVVSFDLKNEMGKLKDEYFALPLHDGIRGLVQYQMQDLVQSELDSYMTIVFTNSSISIKIETYFEKWKTQFEKLQTFQSEKQLSSSIEKFWKDEECEILFLQCSAVEDDKHIMLTKTIIERFRVEANDETPTKTIKLVYLAIHLDGSDISTNTVSQISYLSGWKLMMMDTLGKPVMSLKYLCSADLLSVIEKKRPLTTCLKSELFWAFTRIRYGVYGRNHKSISTVLEKMKKDNELLSLIEERICSDMQGHFKGDKNSNWQIKVAYDVNALSTSAHFVGALECFVLNAIKHPLAKIVFKLESLGAIHSYFSGDESRKRLWKYMFQNQTLFSISEMQTESGPWCYSCDRPDLLLVMPFSRAIFESIETTKEDFLVEIPRLRAKCDISEDEALPLHITDELVRQQETYMFKKIPDLHQYKYNNMNIDYVEDFCNLVSYTTCANLTPKSRIHYTKCVIAHDINFALDHSDIFARIHCIFWANSRLYSSVLQLLDSCVEIVEEKEVLEIFKEAVSKTEVSLTPLRVLPTQNVSKSESTIRNGAFHQLIFLVCSKILPSHTCLNKFDTPRQWHIKVRNVMTIAAEVSREPKTLHTLRFCDDIATHFLIPLEEHISELEEIGSLLVDHDLDSETVFTAIKSLLKSTESQLQRSRLLSKYLIRCMTVDPETTTYKFLFKFIKENDIADQCIGQFKAPLQFLFCLEHEVNSEFLYDLVESNAESLNREGKELLPESPFLSELDICLKSTVRSKANCSFNVLIVDLLEELYNETEIDDFSGLILQCGTILQTESDGLRFIAALSLLKEIISRIGIMVSEDTIQHQTVVLYALNATITGIKQKGIREALMVYILKAVAKNSPINEVMKYHKSLTQKCTCLEAIQWAANYSQVCIDSNPLSLFVSNLKKKECLLLLIVMRSKCPKIWKDLFTFQEKAVKVYYFYFH